MNKHLDGLRDPIEGKPLTVTDDQLVSARGDCFPVVKGIPRFVESANYARDFGEQWNRFPRTQLDSFIGIPLSEERLARCMGGSLSDVRGKRVLEAGSGAGRFTEVLLKYGCELDSFDYSRAVEANALNNGASPELTLVQADIRAIPFPPQTYDYVICLGVIQHTPNPEETIACLWRMVKPGGRLVIDHYRRNVWRSLPPPIGNGEIPYRWLLLRLPPEKRAPLVKRIVDFWFPIHWRFRHSRTMQRALVRLSPVKFYYPEMRLRDRDAYYEWALLDTHDGTTDYYKHYRSMAEIYATLASLGAVDIAAAEAGNGVEASCTKPKTGTVSR